MFHSGRFENTKPDGFSVLEVVPTSTSAEAPRLFVPLKRTELTGTLTGPLADLCLTQIFGYTAQQCDRTLEALYRFPLPGDAAVTGVTVMFGEVTIQAELKERAQAEADYTEAKKQGKQAALTTRESPDVFTLQIAGLQPDQEIVVRTSYVQLARTEGKDWTLRIPLTTAPRYVREDEHGSRHAEGQPLALLRDPGHRFSLDLDVAEADRLHSTTHALEIQSFHDHLHAGLKEGTVLPDRDCLLSWQARQETQHPALHLLLHPEPDSDHLYFLALAAPPRAPLTRPLPREIILLIDRSGSMEGDKWKAADWTAARLLDSLTPEDSFALGLFHDTTHWLSPHPLAATADHLKGAHKFLHRKDSGGTELGVALEQALSRPRDSELRARHVLVLTDAEVSDGGRLLRLVQEEGKQFNPRRVSIVCIDSAPNAHLVNELVEAGNGIAKFLTSSPAEEEMTQALGTLVEDFRAPLLSDLRLEINRPNVEVFGKTVTSLPQEQGVAVEIGDLPAGRAVWLAGRLPRGASPELAFRLHTAAGQLIASSRRDLDQETTPRPALKALFGARRLNALEYLVSSGSIGKALRKRMQELGYSEEQSRQVTVPEGVYAENTRQKTQEALHKLLVAESLEYGLACSETAFIAIRQEADKKVEETVVVANALPQGWSEGFVGPLCAVGGSKAYGANAHSSMREAMALYSAHDAYGADPGPRCSSRTKTSPSIYQLQEESLTSTDIHEVVAQFGAQVESGGEEITTQRTPTTNHNVSLFRRLLDALRGKQKPSSHSPLTTALRSLLIYVGVPTFTEGEALLFDTRRTPDAARLQNDITLRRLELTLLTESVDPDTLDPDLALRLYLGDLTTPCIEIPLADLLRRKGVGPVDRVRSLDETVRIVLVDPAHAWQQEAPFLELRLAW